MEIDEIFCPENETCIVSTEPSTIFYQRNKRKPFPPGMAEPRGGFTFFPVSIDSTCETGKNSVK